MKKVITTLIGILLLLTRCFSETKVYYPEVFIDNMEIDYAEIEVADINRNPPGIPKELEPVKVAPDQRIKLVYEEKPKDFHVYVYRNGKLDWGKAWGPRSSEQSIRIRDEEGDYLYLVRARWGIKAKTEVIFSLEVEK